jgi:PKD repeat protein
MLKRYLSSSLFAALLLCLMANGLMATSAQAQDSRPSGLYIRAKTGANSYAGDRDFNAEGGENGENSLGDFFGTTDEPEAADGNIEPNADEDISQISLPTIGGEIGYNAKFGFFNGGLALTYIGGQYTGLINHDFANTARETSYDEEKTIYAVDSESSRWRHTIGLIGRIGFAGSSVVQPYVQLGGQGTFGRVFSESNGEPGDEDPSEYELTFGPTAGVGVDFALTPRIGFFLEATGSATFPDGNIDLHPGATEDDNGFDVLGFYGGGLRYSLGSVFTPVEIVSLDCPAELEAGESGTFTATINEGEATAPISSDWEFGDGTTATGLVATKTYNSPGTYTVTFNTSNDGASASRNCTIEVVEPPQPAIVSSIDSNPNPSDVDESVSFTSNVRGDRPVDCEWDFGDGETSSSCNPTHTYDEAGSYNVTFTASNEFGSDTASLTQVVEAEAELPAICTNVTEFNAAFFGRNSSTLSAEARDNLRDNLEILEQCPNLCVDVEGFASRAERNTDELSQDRADAVAEFYEDNGIDSDRIDAEGMGARGQTTKKGGNAQFRRADSIPESCAPAGENSDDDPDVGSSPDFDEDDMMDDDSDM